MIHDVCSIVASTGACCVCDLLSWCTMLFVSVWFLLFFFFQAEDGIRDLVRSRGLGDVYKRQVPEPSGTYRTVRATKEIRMEDAKATMKDSEFKQLSLIHI